ncbi:hypothetical protein M441DRAFT_303947 [Trichoderma asperellum CBS 433.97]|uniref:Uncharacterized protein n=1 Tax=Trichoderma asperellum (strain ATCC 204424 / CBS 433.97 / NBRC 101777) TaxID=1042311 RepID=A0A2T3ZJR7_TRIA4|nr:hypothetical protein M441DRAFT_303947 [Trichoderma asperellum CBS 433.97]PTB45022.1 hypothetical protein M441DRAFT_303947 [Trichoderma asperellum CBS 433.97]
MALVAASTDSAAIFWASMPCGRAVGAHVGSFAASLAGSSAASAPPPALDNACCRCNHVDFGSNRRLAPTSHLPKRRAPCRFFFFLLARGSE